MATCLGVLRWNWLLSTCLPLPHSPNILPLTLCASCVMVTSFFSSLLALLPVCLSHSSPDNSLIVLQRSSWYFHLLSTLLLINSSPTCPAGCVYGCLLVLPVTYYCPFYWQNNLCFTYPILPVSNEHGGLESIPRWSATYPRLSVSLIKECTPCEHNLE